MRIQKQVALKPYHLIILVFLALFVSNLRALSSFELHNIDKAHEQGYTGKGVNLGIIDGGFDTNHPYLAANILEVIKNSSYVGPNGDYKSHGTHVAGIIAATKTNGSSYGIASNSKFIGYGNVGMGISTPQFNRMLDYGVKIINNSHNGNYPQLRHYAKNNDILIVYAAGNSNFFSPHSAARHGTGSASNLGAWLVVGNLRQAAIKKDTSGQAVLGQGGSFGPSNMCIGSKAYCVVAAGTWIHSLNKNSSFTSKQGTSMAAPAVSGVAALVAEKYPFLGGKQLADVILGTANKNFKVPKVFIWGAYVIYVDEPIPKKNNKNDDEKIRQDLTALYGPNVGTRANLDKVIFYTKEDIYGQGIVDAEAALKGLNLIDINRLGESDINVSNGTQIAFYTLDTKGYNALFENDIGQRKWDKKYQNPTTQNLIGNKMSGLDAGLIKKGAGTLSISGNLNYLGDTIVENGELRLLGKGGVIKARMMSENSAQNVNPPPPS